MASLYTGIDLGYDQLKVVSLRRGKNGLQLAGAGMVRIRDYDRSDPEWPQQMAKILRQLIKKNSIPIGQVIAGISGGGCMLRYMTMPVMPPWRLEMAMSYEVEEQVSNMDADASTIARDYRILQIPDFDADMFPIMLALVQDETTRQRLSICSGGTKAKVSDTDLIATSAFNLFCDSPQCNPDEISMLIDMGARETQLTVQQGGNLLLARNIPFGGNRFDERIQQAYGVLPDKAEEIKFEHGQIIPGDDDDWYPDDVVKINNAVMKDVSSFCQTVKGTLSYFSREFKIPAFKPEAVYYTGGATQFPGLMAEVGRRLRVRVESLEISSCMAIKNSDLAGVFASPAGARFSAAAGLAASRLGQGHVCLSLLPEEEKKKRKFRDTEIFVYYTAVLAVVLLVVLAVGAWKDLSIARDRNSRWKARLGAARQQHTQLAKQQKENERLFALARDMGLRENSGRDLLACLQILRQNTPGNVFYTSISTLNNISSRIGTAGALNNSDTFQKQRAFYLSGFLVGASTENMARSQLDAFVIKLQETGLLTQVTQIRVQLVRDQEEELKARIKKLAAAGKPVKDLEEVTTLPGSLQELNRSFIVETGGDRGREFPMPKGAALSFLVRCEVGDIK